MASQYTNRDYRPHELIHFTVRGHNRRSVFHNQADQDEFLDDLRDRIDLSPQSVSPTLLGYAQMSNHQHVYTRAGADPTHTSKLIRAARQAARRRYENS